MTDETLAAAACALAVTADLHCTHIIGAAHRLHHARSERPRLAPYLIEDIRRDVAALTAALMDIEEALRAKREAA